MKPLNAAAIKKGKALRGATAISTVNAPAYFIYHELKIVSSHFPETLTRRVWSDDITYGVFLGVELFYSHSS